MNRDGIFSTACPRNCYSSCAMNVRIENGRVKAILPDPSNRATAGGPCLKGLSYVERAHSHDRIVQPLRRSGPGKFRSITWDEALDEIASNLIRYKSEYGPRSVLYYESSGMAGLMNQFGQRFWKLYGGATTTYGNLCWPAGLEAVRLTLGDNRHNAPWDLANSRLVIIWGKNPAETNIHQMVFIEQAAAAGARVVVIDPRRTPSAERADLLIQPRPGTDGALALALARELIARDRVDHDFIHSCVKGFREFSESVVDWTPARAAAITGVPEASIHLLADYLTQIKPMTLIPGYGMQRYPNGGQTIRCLLALSILTGNIGKPGACFHYANLQSYVYDAVKEPASYYPETDPDPAFRRTVSKARLAGDMMKQDDPPLKMAWVERGNPVSQNPDSGKTREAFRNLGFRVVVEEFMTDTAAEADIILPAKNLFEQSDIIGCYWHPYVQLKPALLDPPPGVKPESEIWYLLALKLGIAEPEVRKQIPRPGEEHTLEILKQWTSGIAGLDWEALQQGPQPAPGWEEIAFDGYRFPTPSGKAELWSEEAVNRWHCSALPSYEPLPEQDPVHPFFLLSPNTKNRIHSQFGNLELIRPFDPEPQAVINAADAMAKNIRDGDRIRIYNDRGRLETRAKISFGLRGGCVVYFNGYWNSEGGSPNMLTGGRETDMGHGTAFHDTRVQIEKL